MPRTNSDSRRTSIANGDPGPKIAFQRIWAIVDSIPPGRVASYGQVAEVAGLPRRARLAARALRETPPGTRLPWHRVIGADGAIRTVGSTASEQRARLKREGIRFDARGRVDFGRFGWVPEF